MGTDRFNRVQAREESCMNWNSNGKKMRIKGSGMDKKKSEGGVKEGAGERMRLRMWDKWNV